ncbi:MAG: HAMP domain-containing histidine kinase [Chloroflexi bacterium]|nr:HAMP domain-containing histidine kinase [Chloroflexota bacterium]
MNVVQTLKDLYPDWLEAASDALAQGDTTRQSLRPQLERFYELLLQSVETEDPTWLDSILYLWVWSQTVTDLNSEDITIIGALQALLDTMLDVARARLTEAEALQLMEALRPYWFHMMEYAANQEMRARLDHTVAELERIQRELERLDKSKSDFISVAAHELKTPLTLIEGYAAMLRDALEPIDPQLKSQIAPMLEGIFRGSERIREIVDDLTDVSLIDNNMLKLAYQPVWLGQIFRALADELAPVLEERHLTLKIHRFPGSERMIFGDLERLRQVFRNLLTNAIKYTPDGGKITIDGRLLPGFIEVRVSDTGIGIAPEDQQRIFDKFGRVGDPRTHSSGKTRFKGGGPGLGLPIAKGIVEAHGGSIWVESPGYDEEKCPGSTFHVLLPLREEQPDAEKGSLFAKLAAYIKKGEQP